MAKRRTLAREISASGVTLHAGVPVQMQLLPDAAGAGLRFRRIDVQGSAPVEAIWSNVTETRLGTVLTGTDGVSVGVVEHLLAALAGAEVDDCLVVLDGPEPPILDGDALSFLELIDQAGIKEVEGPRNRIRVLRGVEAEAGQSRVALRPAAELQFHAEIDFASAAIGRQEFEVTFTGENFRREIAPARTFGFLHEAEQLRKAGYGRGADLSNTLVIDGDHLMNPKLQRFADEFVRHKILDAAGDMKLAGAPLLARYEGRRSSHTLNNALLRALFADEGNYERVAE